MKRRVYAGNSGVWIDSCDTCGGVWCDGGEFATILRTIEPNALHDSLIRLLAEDAKADARRDEQAIRVLESLRFITAPGVGPFSLVIAAIVFIIQHIMKDILAGTGRVGILS